MKKHPILRRFMKRKASVLGAVILLLFFFTALLGPFLCSQDPYEQDVTQIHKGPSLEHWFGTDYLGRDTFTRLVYGARVSLALSSAAWFPVRSSVSLSAYVPVTLANGWIRCSPA